MQRTFDTSRTVAFAACWIAHQRRSPPQRRLRQRRVLQTKIDRVMRWKFWRNPLCGSAKAAETNELRFVEVSTESWLPQLFMRMSLLLVSCFVASCVVEYFKIHEIRGVLMIAVDCLMSSVLSFAVCVCKLMLYIHSYKQEVTLNSEYRTRWNSIGAVLEQKFARASHLFRYCHTPMRRY